MSKVYFSLQEANEMIKRITKDVERLVQLRDEVSVLDNTKIEFDEDSVENVLLEVELNKSFHEKSFELYSILGLLIRRGCIIKDLDELEIDFYSRLGDREILFCWMPGEKTISFWHEPGQNKNKRRSIKLIENSYIENLKRLR